MPNQRQLDLLNKGKDYWQRLRAEQPELRPDLSGAHLAGADLSELDLSYADLRGADLSGADCWQCCLEDADLSNGLLIQTSLAQANLSRANLSKAALYKASLTGANLTGSQLVQANLSRADLSGANVSSATLHKAKLTYTLLRATHCPEADLSEAEIGWTIFAGLDLSGVKGLALVQHIAPSIIDIETIYRSRGLISEHFLRQAGVPELFITYIPSLVQEPINFYQCFLRYSEQDQEFARRLLLDLQSKGVRCWLVPNTSEEDPPGLADEAIRFYDKLILVLSPSSLASLWLQLEVERVLAQEESEQRRILSFIALEPLKDIPEWLTRLQATHPIEDFCDWKRYDFYRQALGRLLSTLGV